MKDQRHFFALHDGDLIDQVIVTEEINSSQNDVEEFSCHKWLH
jgi:hypothetical protein